ncbi:hypothetical protein MKK84_31050 [Methylobacterium sp. E-065]|uniref:hypothetical protein n=1 Tax=Methylobacterium sp. E-065 TaxID=2836583 RepID=UPI001FBA12CA|nr:hypothetical protein [Methylobacterium sp. E-065]MCJ2021800.1 hypothetical protein [Methylobacterium sp. E-065]
MDDRVRVIGDLVLVRACDPLVKRGPKGLAFQPFPQSCEAFYRIANDHDPFGYRPDALPEGLAWGDGRPSDGRPVGLGPWDGSLADAPFGADTARLLAGFAATAALGVFYEIEGRFGHRLSEPANARPWNSCQATRTRPEGGPGRAAWEGSGRSRPRRPSMPPIA